MSMKKMIESDDYAMVIYVMSPETIQSEDNDELLQTIAKTMNKVGKKADERFLFVINKCDNLDPEDEDDTIENVLETAKAYLKKRGIDKPNIYPVTAEIAKLIRMKQCGENLTRKDKNEIDNVKPYLFESRSLVHNGDSLFSLQELELIDELQSHARSICIKNNRRLDIKI